MPGDHDLDQRLRFLRVDDHGRATLRALKPFLEEELPGALSAGYDQLRAFPDAQGKFRDQGLLDQARTAARRHWDGVANGEFDDRYLASVSALGRVHAKAGLEPRHSIAGAALVAEQLVRAMVRRTWPKAGLFRDKKAPTAEQVADSLAALIKAVMLDMDIVVSSHLDAETEQRARDEQAIIEDQQALMAETIGVGLERLAEGDLVFRLGMIPCRRNTKSCAAISTTPSDSCMRRSAPSTTTPRRSAPGRRKSRPPRPTCRGAPNSRPPAWNRPPPPSTRSPLRCARPPTAPNTPARRLAWPRRTPNAAARWCAKPSRR